MSRPSDTGAVAHLQGTKVVLRLYVARGFPNSTRAIANLQRLLDNGNNDCDLEVVDVMERPQQALADGVLVTPTLLRIAPEPQIRLIGDLSQTDKVTGILVPLVEM